MKAGVDTYPNNSDVINAAYPYLDIVEVNFSSFEQWFEWFGSVSSGELIEMNRRVVEHTSEHGVWEPIICRFSPGQNIRWDHENLRESGVAQNIGARARGVLYAIHSCLGDIDPYKIKIFAPEAITPFAMLMRGHFPKFLGSEYTSSAEVAEELYPIPAEDLTCLTFKDNRFDLIITNEVLEHVPTLDGALREMARVLKPGGWHIGSHPFYFMSKDSLVRTKIEDGRLIHVLPEEWHGDPMGTGGSLVFEIPGWDILDRAKEAGFRRAFMKYIHSPTFGIVADHSGGLFVLCLQK